MRGESRHDLGPSLRLGRDQSLREPDEKLGIGCGIEREQQVSVNDVGKRYGITIVIDGFRKQDAESDVISKAPTFKQPARQ